MALALGVGLGIIFVGCGIAVTVWRWEQRAWQRYLRDKEMRDHLIRTDMLLESVQRHLAAEAQAQNDDAAFWDLIKSHNWAD